MINQITPIKIDLYNPGDKQYYKSVCIYDFEALKTSCPDYISSILRLNFISLKQRKPPYRRLLLQIICTI